MTAITALAQPTIAREANYKIVLFSDRDNEVPLFTFRPVKRTFEEWMKVFRKKINPSKGATLEYIGFIVHEAEYDGTSITLHTK